MACWSEYGYEADEVNGVCPDCGVETVDGKAAYGCPYSPVACETCGHQPCDGSC